ncbi:hypothetical protein [Bacillus thuringiensis]|uniref:hypothetical protein n=1 Tax=Bacillus thuringiensis TaxID=1428 RepID=UPI000BF8F5B0|nr:hypothetical protein [Bacillus thuringiensis]PFJ08897.1 hypothetical protein COI87_24865 [Bacillus thuringiensis]
MKKEIKKLINDEELLKLESVLRPLFNQFVEVKMNIRKKLEDYSDGKNLKGDEIVGWLGEIYGKILFSGILVDDSQEHDFQINDEIRVSVKARKGYKSGWNRTSAIPKIEGEDCPTHLMFIHFNDDYSIDRIWLFPWEFLMKNDRFKEHIVREERRSFILTIRKVKDMDFIIYNKN